MAVDKPPSRTKTDDQVDKSSSNKVARALDEVLTDPNALDIVRQDSAGAPRKLLTSGYTLGALEMIDIPNLPQEIYSKDIKAVDGNTWKKGEDGWVLFTQQYATIKLAGQVKSVKV
jgi:hypothetical protein